MAKKLPTAHLDDIPAEVLTEFELVGPKCWCLLMDNILHSTNRNLYNKLKLINKNLILAANEGVDPSAHDVMI